MSSPSFVIENDRPIPKGGQVPLLKHACMAWLQKNLKDNGRIHGDSYNIAADTKAAVPNVVRALYDLQKQGLVTFRERKHAGTNGHGSQKVLNHFELTPKGIEWTADKAIVADIETVATNTWDDLNPEYVAADATERVAQDMAVEAVVKALDGMKPADALKAVLSRTGPLPIRKANVLLGYHRGSTALYSIVRSYPEAFKRENAEVSFIGPDDWKAPTQGGARQRLAVDPALVEEARASVALDGDTQVVEPVAAPEDDPGFRAIVAIDLVGAYPAISALMARAEKRTKVQAAVAILEEQGLDEEALLVMSRIPDDTDLEAEIITLVKEMRS